MKKSTLIFGMLALAAITAAGVACNKHEPKQEQEEELKFDLYPQPANEEVTAFFETETLATYMQSNHFTTGMEREFCVAINSVEEFRNFLPVEEELPAIDFEQYTLVIGSYCAGSNHYIRGHGINTEPQINMLNLIVLVRRKGVILLDLVRRYYWGLYPKLPPNRIGVNVIYE